jgi:cytochrome b6-f complex iron-sulfur subunit
MEVSKSTDHLVSRRTVLCGVALIAAGLTTEGAAAATTATGVTQAGKKLKLDLTKNAALSKVGGVVQIDLSDGSSIAVVRTAAGVKGLTAINLACTHNGVNVMQEGTSWVCPAHGSEFALSGKLVKGPARSALKKYAVSATAKTLTIG